MTGVTTRSGRAVVKGALLLPSPNNKVRAAARTSNMRSSSSRSTVVSAAAAKSNGKRPAAASDDDAASDDRKRGKPSHPLLLTLDPKDCALGTFLRRPSKRNRSPYVADVYVDSLQREALVHVPNLDMGGKCRAGSRMLVKTARDRMGIPVGPHAVSPKYGTPKCEFLAQLVLVDDDKAILDSCSQTDKKKNNDTTPINYYEPTWVGAHPSLGEQLAEQLLRHHDCLCPDDVSNIRRQVTLLDKTMRADFVLTHASGKDRIVEVKTVVDTDYSCETHMDSSLLKGVVVSQTLPYQRCALFPWGQSKQKGPDGEAVVSARAIKHIRELTRYVQQGEYAATLVLLVIRSDAQVFRPNHDACPSFAKYLRQAHDAGVQILVPRVQWQVNEDDAAACCYFDRLLDIQWPTSTSS